MCSSNCDPLLYPISKKGGKENCRRIWQGVNFGGGGWNLILRAGVTLTLLIKSLNYKGIGFA